MNEIRQGDFFSDAHASKTYGIKYAGSKQKIIPHILREVSNLDVKSVLDGFSGTTRVSQALALNGYNVVCNDISVWSETFGKAFLYERNDSEAGELIDHLNSLEPIDGWFTENYGGDIADEKKVWQRKNTRKLDAIRLEIDRLNLSPVNKSIALAALILGLDKVDSTLGHYASYLKDWSSRSHNDLKLTLPPYQGNYLRHSVLREDINNLSGISVDLAYLDPPYGSNNEKMPPSRVRYASYYHIWTTIIKNDRPEIFGAANRRVDTKDTIACSPFEEFRKDTSGKFLAVNAIDRMLEKINAKYILLSYSSGGRATAEELFAVISKTGNLIDTICIDYKKHIMASMKWTNEWTSNNNSAHKEFLFLVEKKQASDYSPSARQSSGLMFPV